MAALCRPFPSASSLCSCSYSLPSRSSSLAVAIARAFPSFPLSLFAPSRPSPPPLSYPPAFSSSPFSSSTQNEEFSSLQQPRHPDLPFTLPTQNLASPPHSHTQNDPWHQRQIEGQEWLRKEDAVYEAGLAERGDALPQAQDDAWYRIQAEDEEWFRKEEEIYEARLAERERPSRQARPQVDPDYLSLSDSALFAQCRMDTFRASGPGGQHRNKTDSGVRLTHIPTNLVTQAVDDRSQHKNRATAMSRLRLLIAAKVRRPVKLRGYKPPLELERLFPAEGGKKSNAEKIGVNHPDYAKGVQSLLDLLAAVDGFVFFAAGILRVSPGAFSKILTSDKIIQQATNELLVSKGQKPFK